MLSGGNQTGEFSRNISYPLPKLQIAFNMDDLNSNANSQLL